MHWHTMYEVARNTGHCALIAAVACIVAACGEGGTDNQNVNPNLRVNRSAEPMLRAVVIIDQSGSAPKNRIEPMTADQFQPLMDEIAEQGGELAVGTIQNNSNRPLERLRIEPPPTPPPSPPENQNPFERARQAAERSHETAKYERDIRSHKERVRQKIQRFREVLTEVLKRKRDANRSDIGRAIVRSELFLQEPLVTDRPVSRFAILITDGLDNVTEELPAVKSGATYLLVNGTGAIGILSDLNAKTFESSSSAFSYAVHQMSSRGSTP